MKKLAVVLGSLLVLFVALLLLLPVFYPADQLRPKIEAAINQKVRGKVKLGKITLRAFPTLKLHIEETVAVAPAPWNKESLATISSIDLKMPLLSLLFAPKVVIQLNDPQIQLTQRGEESNLSAFLPDPQVAAAQEAAATPVQPGEEKAVGETIDALPGFVANRVRAARVDFTIQNGSVQVVDLKAPKGNKTSLSKMNFSLEGIGLAHAIEVNFQAAIDYLAGDTKAQGDIKTTGTVKYSPNGKDTKIEVDLQNDLTALAIEQQPLFVKPAGTDLAIKMKGVVNQGLKTDANLESFDLKLGELIARASLNVEDATSELNRKIAMSLQADNVQLAPFGALVPMVRDYKLAGTVSLNAKVNGLLSNPALDVLVQLSKVSGATPQLQRPISDLNGKIEVKGTVKEPSVLVDPFSLKVGVSDLNLRLAVKGLDRPDANIRLSSKRLDVDELMGLKPGTAAPQSAGTQGTAADAKSAATEPLDESLDKMAPELEKSLANPMLDKARATIVMDLKSIKAMGAEYNNATFNMSYAARSLKVSKTGLGGYGGKLILEGAMGLFPKAPTYDIKAGLNGINLAEAIRAHAPEWKDQLSGTMVGDFKIAGKGLRKAQLNETLNGSLSGEIKSGRLNLPIVKLVEGVVKNLPSFGGKKAEIPENQKNREFRGEFKTCKLVSSIKGRVVNLQDLDVVFAAEDSKLGDMQFKSNGTVTFDRKVDILGTAFLDPSVVKFDPLKGPSGKIELPMKFAGDMSDPKPDYAYTVKIVGPKMAKSALKSEPVQKAVEKLQEKAPENVKKGIDELRKKFKF